MISTHASLYATSPDIQGNYMPYASACAELDNRWAASRSSFRRQVSSVVVVALLVANLLPLFSSITPASVQQQEHLASASKPTAASKQQPRQPVIAAQQPVTPKQQVAARQPKNSAVPAAGLAPNRQVNVFTGRVIALDAGHGGANPGARGQAGSYEKDNTLATVYQVKKVLEAAGAQVVLTRWGDAEPGLSPGTDPADLQTIITRRARIAGKMGADVLISIHNDSNANRELAGTTTYYWGSPLLAQKVQHALTAQLGSRNLGTERSDFYILTTSRMPAILVEVGFISNQHEEQLLRSAWYQKEVALGIKAGLQSYFQSIAA